MNKTVKTAELLKIVKKPDVIMVEAVIRNGCVKVTHYLYEDKGKLYDEGCDGEVTEICAKEFKKNYSKTNWTIEQVLTEEMQNA